MFLSFWRCLMGFKTESHDDMSLFRNRLWKLMDKKGIDSAPKLAAALHEKCLIKVNSREKEDEKRSDTEKKQLEIKAIEKKIQRHLNSDSCERLQGEFVMAYCKFFSCSADYLFGKIECSTHEKQICHNLTGLSEDAIEVLEAEKNSYFPYALTAINFLLEKDAFIDDKRELFRLIIQYTLSSQNIKSYSDCNAPKMENDNIPLYDEYGTVVANAPIDKMANVFLLSINELLSKLKNNISKTLERKKPTLWEILDLMLYDFVCMERIQENQNGFNFDIEYLSELKRRFEENNKRLVYLYRCNNLDDIDFVSFKKFHPQYSNETIENFKKILLFY